MPNQDSGVGRDSEAGEAPDEARHVRRSGQPTIGMAGFEAVLVAASGIDIDIDAQRPAGGVPWQGRGPGVEWAIVWADGRVVPVHSEAAARVVVARRPGCEVFCRIVGGWGPA